MSYQQRPVNLSTRDEAPPRTFSEREAAAALSVSRSTLHRARRGGRLKFYRIGRSVRYSAAHLREFLRTSEGLASSEYQSLKGAEVAGVERGGVAR